MSAWLPMWAAHAGKGQPQCRAPLLCSPPSVRQTASEIQATGQHKARSAKRERALGQDSTSVTRAGMTAGTKHLLCEAGDMPCCPPARQYILFPAPPPRPLACWCCNLLSCSKDPPSTAAACGVMAALAAPTSWTLGGACEAASSSVVCSTPFASDQSAGGCCRACRLLLLLRSDVLLKLCDKCLERDTVLPHILVMHVHCFFKCGRSSRWDGCGHVHWNRGWVHWCRACRFGWLQVACGWHGCWERVLSFGVSVITGGLCKRSLD